MKVTRTTRRPTHHMPPVSGFAPRDPRSPPGSPPSQPRPQPPSSARRFAPLKPQRSHRLQNDGPATRAPRVPRSENSRRIRPNRSGEGHSYYQKTDTPHAPGEWFRSEGPSEPAGLSSVKFTPTPRASPT
ncbi:hypothetical protein DB30_01518 [Enhygromyxa salina]|uniref:Uncharacterized protein n=1 Tax=Enhygromyxa salina TaxID=215803 RepID=A0A0C2CMB2_9BACT|nr:hypothetical protein DB30_01518 [Enhygromyxa salina]